MWGRVSVVARASDSNQKKWVRIQLVPLSKALYHTCFICGWICKWWAHRWKLTSSVISHIKPIVYIYIYFFLPQVPQNLSVQCCFPILDLLHCGQSVSVDDYGLLHWILKFCFSDWREALNPKFPYTIEILIDWLLKIIKDWFHMYCILYFILFMLLLLFFIYYIWGCTEDTFVFYEINKLNWESTVQKCSLDLHCDGVLTF